MSGPFDRWLSAVPVSNSLTTEQSARAQSARIAAEVTRISGLTAADMDDLIAVAEWVMTGESPETVEEASSDLNTRPNTALWSPGGTPGTWTTPLVARGGLRFPVATTEEDDMPTSDGPMPGSP